MNEELKKLIADTASIDPMCCKGAFVAAQWVQAKALLAIASQLENLYTLLAAIRDDENRHRPY